MKQTYSLYLLVQWVSLFHLNAILKFCHMSSMESNVPVRKGLLLFESVVLMFGVSACFHKQILRFTGLVRTACRDVS